MAVKVPFQYIDGVAEPARSQLWRDFEEIQRALDILTPGGVPGSPGWTVGGDLTVTGIFRSKKAGGAPAPSRFWDGIEIAHPASTPFIDFHRSADPEEATDYNLRLINDATDTLTMVAASGGVWANLRSSRFKVGAYGWNSGYAHFGNRDYMDASNVAYAFMDGPGETLVNGRTVLHLRYNGGNKLEIGSDGTRFHDWARSLNSGQGHYHQAHGGGWFMQDGTYFRTYGGKEIYCDNKVRGQIARMGDGIWGDHATFGHNNYGPASNACGLLQRWDSTVWLRSNTEVIMHVNGSDLMWIKSSGGWLELTGVFPMNLCGTAVHVGGDWGGNRRQLGACSSSARWKKDIVDLPEKARGRNNPVFGMKSRRFFWREDLGGNGADVNQWRPEGSTGLITEEIVEVAPEAVSRDYDGTPTAPDMYAFFAYLVDAVQYLRRRLDNQGVADG